MTRAKSRTAPHRAQEAANIVAQAGDGITCRDVADQMGCAPRTCTEHLSMAQHAGLIHHRGMGANCLWLPGKRGEIKAPPPPRVTSIWHLAAMAAEESAIG